MKTFRIELIVTVSDNADEQELKDYIEFELGQGGGISNENAFITEDPNRSRSILSIQIL